MTAATESSAKTTHNLAPAAEGALSFGALRVRGADAGAFLQGQLSNDMTQLAPERSLLAGYHNPQGRVIALLRVLQLGPQDVLCVLPHELVATLLQRLQRFVLRAKVQLTDESAAWRVHGFAQSQGTQLPAQLNRVAHSGEALLVQVTAVPGRWLAVMPASAALAEELGAPLSESAWRAAAVAAGEPQVYAATSEEFVAQMLNLDVLGAIAFEKGCYTGQEVIARAHYRGRVKRRLQRFVSAAPVRLAPGDTAELGDGRSLKVVEAATRADGRCEFLAVTALPGEVPAPPAAAGFTPLPLPYALPE